MKKFLVALTVLLISGCAGVSSGSLKVTGGLRVRHYDRGVSDYSLAFWINGPASVIEKIESVGFFSEDKETLTYSHFQANREKDGSLTIFVQGSSKNIDPVSFNLKVKSGKKWIALKHPELKTIPEPMPKITQLDKSRDISVSLTSFDIEELDSNNYLYDLQIYDLKNHKLVYSKDIEKSPVAIDLSGITNSGQYLVGVAKRDKNNDQNMLSREYTAVITLP